MLEKQDNVKAESVLRECCDGRAKFMPDSWDTSHTQSPLSAALLRQENWPEAKPMLVGHDGLMEREWKIPAVRQTYPDAAAGQLGQLYTAQGDLESAAAWQRTLDRITDKQAISCHGLKVKTTRCTSSGK